MQLRSQFWYRCGQWSLESAAVKCLKGKRSRLSEHPSRLAKHSFQLLHEVSSDIFSVSSISRRQTTHRVGGRGFRVSLVVGQLLLVGTDVPDDQLPVDAAAGHDGRVRGAELEADDVVGSLEENLRREVAKSCFFCSDSSLMRRLLTGKL